MAKKNIASLMNGIMGDAKPKEPEVSSENTQEVPVSEVTQEMRENHEAKRHQMMQKLTGVKRDPGQEERKSANSLLHFNLLKCKRELADLARTCISVLDSLSEKERNAITAANMDGTASEYKGSGSKYWADHDSFSTPWNIRINGETDFRIFALAYLVESPSHVIIEWFNPSMLTVQLRWQRVNEVGRLMMTYGNLMARKNRLKASEQEMLGKMPYNVTEILYYLTDIKALN